MSSQTDVCGDIFVLSCYPQGLASNLKRVASHHNVFKAMTTWNYLIREAQNLNRLKYIALGMRQGPVMTKLWRDNGQLVE